MEDLYQEEDRLLWVVQIPPHQLDNLAKPRRRMEVPAAVDE
jgi:hypothetical protein